MRYKAVLFDNDDTLMDFQTCNRNAVDRLMDELGYTHPQRCEQYEAVNRECWAALERGELDQSRLRSVRFTRFFERHGISGDPERAGARFVELLAEQNALLPHAEQVVREISAQLPVVIVTNGMTSVQRSRLGSSPLMGLVRGVVISEEVGAAKPQPEIFNLALEIAGVSPGEALMIGDGATGDILGANNAGIDACWYDPMGLPLPEGIHAEYVIRDIRECVKIALQP